MPSTDEPVAPERRATDEKLKNERLKADEHVDARAGVAEQDAADVVDLARERADCVLKDARRKADAGTPEASPRSEDARSHARASHDHAVSNERAAADDQVEDEREADKRGLAKILTRERAQADEGLRMERARSDHSVASRDDFLAIVSHDVRGIIGGLSMSTELLGELTRADDGPVRAEVARIGRLTGRMTRLVGDLLDVVSMESGRLSAMPSRQAVGPLLNETRELFELAAGAAQVGLLVEAPAGELEARFDHERILQVLTNLVGNAMKFTGRGGSIALEAAAIPGGVRISVRDTGRGIPGSELEAIFGRFSRLGQDDRRGLGLGLYIARCIVDAHGGKIWAESERGLGSSFHFTLPDEDPSSSNRPRV